VPRFGVLALLAVACSSTRTGVLAECALGDECGTGGLGVGRLGGAGGTAGGSGGGSAGVDDGGLDGAGGRPPDAGTAAGGSAGVDDSGGAGAAIAHDAGPDAVPDAAEEPDPCEGVTCESPPPNACASPTSVQVYSAFGSCGDGGCAYGYVEIPCATSCAGGACT
jgi:hypothetical protein